MQNKHIHIVGAGFSGLCLAYYFNRANFPVTVYEKAERPGGLLTSPTSEFGLIEQAANGMVLNQQLLQLCNETGVDYIAPDQLAKNKYLYSDNKKTKWPFAFWQTVALAFKVLLIKLNPKKYSPKPGETLRAWGERVFNPRTVNELIEPAFQGVYATGAANLSARLVTKNFFQKRQKSKSTKVKRQTVSFSGGMQGFCQSLSEHLEKQGVNFHFNKKVEQLLTDEITYVCTDPRTASDLLKQQNPKLSDQLKTLKKVSIAKVARFTEELPSDGFGCLFPANSKINSMGVLFDSNLFPGHVQNKKLQTWILAANDDTSDDRLKNLVDEDMSTFWGQELEVASEDIKIWKQTLPCYNTDLESLLNTYDMSQPVAGDSTYLFANYCGDIGLSQILIKAQQHVERML